jgi:hypothetical protein
LPSYSRLYRVFPWIEDAPSGQPGHPLYVAPPQGHGRIDNPEHYLTLYFSDDPSGAIAEAFGNHTVWTSDLLGGPPGVAGSRRALAVVDATDVDVVDLDDPEALTERALRPSQVVTRARGVTQAWALAVFYEARSSGVRWWSYYDPQWGSFGLWDAGGLGVVDVMPLRERIDEVKDVAARMCRLWED